MFDLNICDELNKFLREIRKELKNKGYNKTISKTNQNLGGLHIQYTNEYYTKPHGNIMFEIEKDMINNTLKTRLWYIENNRKNVKDIRLADIKDLC